MTKAQSKQASTPAESSTPVEESTIVEILKPFLASEDGIVVDEYSEGLCGGLPPVATKYAIAIGAVSDADAEKLLAALPKEVEAEEQQQ